MKLGYKSKIRLKRVLVFAAACMIVAFLAVLLRGTEGADGNSSHNTPAFSHSSGLFAVAVELSGSESTAQKQLLYSSLAGCGVKAAIFCSCDYIAQNRDEIATAVKEGHTVCILLSPDEGSGKHERMRYIAAQNDRFFTLTGKYPLFARTTGETGSETSSIIESYGQILINGGAVCLADGCGEGSLIVLKSLGTDEICTLIKEIDRRRARGERCVLPGELLTQGAK